MRLFLMLAAAVASLALASPSHAQAEKAVRSDGQGNLPKWIVTCGNGNSEGVFRCVMQQSLFLSSTKQRVLTLSIEKSAAGYVATLLLPHGIDFSKGVGFQVDDGPESTAIVRHADQNGSYASFALDAQLLQAMKRGAIFRAKTFPMDGESLIIELSLSGFSDSLSIVERN